VDCEPIYDLEDQRDWPEEILFPFPAMRQIRQIHDVKL